MENVGAFVGKFLPPHKGHVKMINLALNYCDKIIVVLSENPRNSQLICEKDNFPYFDASLRLNWLKNEFKYDKRVSFVYLNTTGIQEFPLDQEKWTKRFWEVVPNNVNVKIAGDISYKSLNEKYFTECKFLYIDRQNVLPISASDIRKSPYNYQEFMLNSTKEYFKKNTSNITSNIFDNILSVSKKAQT